MRVLQLEFVQDGRAAIRLERVACAERFIERCRGLLGRPAPDEDAGLLIRPCSSIHTLGMRYAIDVVWLDRQGRILRLVSSLRPGRVSFCPGARAVLELAAGQIERLGLQPAMQTAWRETCA